MGEGLVRLLGGGGGVGAGTEQRGDVEDEESENGL